MAYRRYMKQMAEAKACASANADAAEAGGSGQQGDDATSASPHALNSNPIDQWNPNQILYKKVSAATHSRCPLARFDSNLLSISPHTHAPSDGTYYRTHARRAEWRAGENC